jgi:hypothetical protein
MRRLLNAFSFFNAPRFSSIFRFCKKKSRIKRLGLRLGGKSNLTGNNTNSSQADGAGSEGFLRLFRAKYDFFLLRDFLPQNPPIF